MSPWWVAVVAGLGALLLAGAEDSNMLLDSLELSTQDVDASTEFVANGMSGCDTICSCVSDPSISYCCPGGLPDATKCGYPGNVPTGNTVIYCSSSIYRAMLGPGMSYTLGLGCPWLAVDGISPCGEGRRCDAPKRLGAVAARGSACSSDEQCPGEVCCRGYCTVSGACASPLIPLTALYCTSDTECPRPLYCCLTMQQCTTLQFCANSLFNGRRYNV